MLLDTPLIADLQAIQAKRQQLINNRLIIANRKRISYDYVIGQEVLKITFKPKKLQAKFTGPFLITSVHTNGTVTIRLSPAVIERISIH